MIDSKECSHPCDSVVECDCPECLGCPIGSRADKCGLCNSMLSPIVPAQHEWKIDAKGIDYCAVCHYHAFSMEMGGIAND